MTLDSNRAGGKATMRGMSFQAQVGVWFAAQLLSQQPIGARFGVNQSAVLESIAFETRKGLDDIRALLTHDCVIDVQCKTSVNLETAATSALGKTVAQLVDLYLELLPKGAIDHTRVAAVLIVQDSMSRSIANLEAACRLFDSGGDWLSVKASLSDGLADAVSAFENHLRAAWSLKSTSPLTDHDLAAMARLFRIESFESNHGQRDWVAAAGVLGSEVYGGSQVGMEAMPVLATVVQRLIAGAASANRLNLLAQMRARGQEDKQTPGFQADHRRLQDATCREVERIARHARLPYEKGVSVPRSFMGQLEKAIFEGSLLVTGDPGAGKTGVLVSLVEHRLARDLPTVLLSVDRYPGIATCTDLEEDLKLEHALLSALEAWPGSEPGVLVIDALDASRGGSSEAVFGTLIADAVAKLGARWSVVASIRTFDLKNGRRFQEVMRGTPPDKDFMAEGIEGVRHFKIPALSPEELKAAGGLIPSLGRLLEAAPLPLTELLSNAFNLALAVELLNEGVSAADIKAIATQSKLIDRYEDVRLDSAALQNSAGGIVGEMVRKGRLVIRKSEVPQLSVDVLLQRNVLAPAGDRVAFAHHILFDHIAGRFYLSWDHAADMQRQVAGGAAVGLLLGPSIRFAIRRMWTELENGPHVAWNLAIDLLRDNDVDAMTSSTALRTVVANVESPANVASLCRRITLDRAGAEIKLFVLRLTRFVHIFFEENQGLTSDQAQAWILVAEAALASSSDIGLADSARFLLRTVQQASDKAATPLTAKFSEVARTLLALSWDTFSEYPALAVNAIGLVAASFCAAPTESKTLLKRLFTEPHFSDRAYDEGRELADKIIAVASCDPSFAVEVYQSFFGRLPANKGESFLGGQSSRIMPLVTTKQQDYQMVRWRLSQAMSEFLRVDPAMATRGEHVAVIGLAALGGKGSTAYNIAMPAGAEPLSIIDDDVWPQDWRASRGRASEDGIKNVFVEHLRKCSDAVFRITVQESLRGEVSGSIIARILGVAAERARLADDLLWPVASQPKMLMIRSLARDAITYLAQAYVTRPDEEKIAFEERMIANDLFDGDRAPFWRGMLGRLLELVPADALITPRMRALREELKQKDELRPNTPFVQIETRGGGDEEIVGSLLKSEGVDIDSGIDRLIYEATRDLKDIVESTKDSKDESAIDRLWPAVLRVTAALDSLDAGAAKRITTHAAWGIVSNAVVEIAKNEAFASGTLAAPTLADLSKLNQRLETSPFPDRADPEHASSWGNWDVRVYAATALMAMAGRLLSTDREVIPRLYKLLADPTPAVRLQVAQSITDFWQADSELVWDLADRISKDEDNLDVLAFFISGPIPWMARHKPETAVEIIRRVMDRADRSLDFKQDVQASHLIDEALGDLGTALWVYGAQDRALEWLHSWFADVGRYDKRIWAATSSLREPLFAKYADANKFGEGDAPRDIQQRAKELLESIFRASSAARSSARDGYEAASSDSGRKEAGKAYSDADHLMSHVCDQLFFGAGAFQQPNDLEPPGLRDTMSMSAFLDEYRDLLRNIGAIGSPGTLHHLFQLYSYLVPADPDRVFDEIAVLLSGPAAKEGYHLESLAADVLVAVVRRYLADYRSSFEDAERRQSLVKVLELFSATGWPEATKLLYDLPDQLR